MNPSLPDVSRRRHREDDSGLSIASWSPAATSDQLHQSDDDINPTRSDFANPLEAQDGGQYASSPVTERAFTTGSSLTSELPSSIPWLSSDLTTAGQFLPGTRMGDPGSENYPIPALQVPGREWRHENSVLMLQNQAISPASAAAPAIASLPSSSSVAWNLGTSPGPYDADPRGNLPSLQGQLRTCMPEMSCFPTTTHATGTTARGESLSPGVRSDQLDPTLWNQQPAAPEGVYWMYDQYQQSHPHHLSSQLSQYQTPGPSTYYSKEGKEEIEEGAMTDTEADVDADGEDEMLWKDMRPLGVPQVQEYTMPLDSSSTTAPNMSIMNLRDSSAADQGDTYAELIYRALMSVPVHSMTLKEIYNWVAQNSDKCNDQENNLGWKNSIRHNLSMNPAFQRTKTRRYDRNVAVWTLEASAVRHGVKATALYRRIPQGCTTTTPDGSESRAFPAAVPAGAIAIAPPTPRAPPQGTQDNRRHK